MKTYLLSFLPDRWYNLKVMEREQNLLNQPGIIESFKQGYQTVSEKLYLILFPFLFDLFLVFGPKLRIDQLVNSILSALPTPKLAQNLMDQWLTTIEQLEHIAKIQTVGNDTQDTGQYSFYVRFQL